MCINNIMNHIEKKINTNKDTYIIFYVPECPYCIKSLKLLRESGFKFKGYDIHKIKGDFEGLYILLISMVEIKYDKQHMTKPIIFFNNEFIGGYDQLCIHIKKKLDKK